MHDNLNFKYEREFYSKLSFLNVTVTRDGNIFETFVFGKPTFSGLDTNLFRNVFDRFKMSAITNDLTSQSIRNFLQLCFV